MKKYYIALYMLIILCIVESSVILIISPDTIPLHYNFKGEVDRWGTKYENLLFPIITVILGVLLTVVPKVQRKKENASNEKIMLIAGVITVAFFDALTLYLGIKAIALSDTEGGLVVPSIGKFIGISMGALLVLLGNIIPKVRKNAAFGLRTKWSMVNDRVWQKSQRFSGIVAVIIGLCEIVTSVFLSDMWIFMTLILFIVTFAVLSTVASYRYYKKDLITNTKGENDNA